MSSPGAIAIHPGDRDDLAYLGWAVDGPDGLARAASAIEAAGLLVYRGDTEVAAERGVEEVAWFVDLCVLNIRPC